MRTFEVFKNNIDIKFVKFVNFTLGVKVWIEVESVKTLEKFWVC